jgi:hypothetical protein
MPIKPENRARYPKDWKQIRAAVLDRAGNRCEGSPKYPDCRVPNGWWRCNETEQVQYFEFAWKASTRIVLTIGHLDHTPENCEMENLRAWCQRCHLAYDHQHHQRNAYATRRKNKAANDLFEQ